MCLSSTVNEDDCDEVFVHFAYVDRRPFVHAIYAYDIISIEMDADLCWNGPSNAKGRVTG